MHELSIDRLPAVAAMAGVKLCTTPDPTAPLYALADKKLKVRYFGKAEAPGGRRHRIYQTMAVSAVSDQLRVGIAIAIRERGLSQQRLSLLGWEPDRARNLLDRWTGPAVAAAKAAVPENLLPRGAERFLIRLLVATGTPNFNAQLAGAWESQWGHPLDVLAQVVAYEAHKNGLL